MSKPKPRPGKRPAQKPVKTTMADYAMSFEQLGQWMSARAKSSPGGRQPQGTSLSMVDGAVSAVVAGPVSAMPEEWVCPLLGVDPDDFNDDTETFSAIAATLMRHNAISETLSTKPETFAPLFVQMADGEIDARPWCMGFLLVLKLRLRDWSRLLTPARIEHRLLLPILSHCVDDRGRPFLPPAMRTESAYFIANAAREIPASVEALRQFWMPTRFKRDA
jgi:yecA family protein